jgi:hypothetical protein
VITNSVTRLKAGPHLLLIDHTVAPWASPQQARTNDLCKATLWVTVWRR